MKQGFWAGGRLLGSREVSPVFKEEGQVWAPLNQMLYCPKCGQAWGSVIYGEPGDTRGWSSHAVVCPRHAREPGDASFIWPGRTGVWPTAWEGDWPEEVVVWEFNQVMRLWREGAVE